MKNLSIKSVTLLAAAMSIMCVQSCKKGNPTPPLGSRIEVNVAIESQKTAQNSASRAGTGEASKTGFANGDQFGLWVVPYLNSETGKEAASELRGANNYVDNALHTLTTGVWQTTAEVFYPNAVALVDLYAVTPYESTMSDPVSANNSMTNPKAYIFTLKSDQTTAANVIASDLMTAKTEKASQGSTPTLTFKHRMSKVLLKFTLKEKYKEKDITGVKSVVVCGVPLKATVDITDDNVAATAATGTNPATEISSYMTSAPDMPVIKGNYIYEAIVMPGATIAAGGSIARVTLIVGTAPDAEEVEFDCKVSASHTFANGKFTTIDVAIEDQTTITVNAADITIDPWTAQTSPGISTVKPAMMIFSVTGSGVAAKCTTIKTAELTLEGKKYTADVVYDNANAKLKCTYRIPSTLFLDELTAVAFHNSTGGVVSNLGVTSSDATGKLLIKKNPYDINNYSYVIATVEF